MQQIRKTLDSILTAKTNQLCTQEEFDQCFIATVGQCTTREKTEEISNHIKHIFEDIVSRYQLSDLDSFVTFHKKVVDTLKYVHSTTLYYQEEGTKKYSLPKTGEVVETLLSENIKVILHGLVNMIIAEMVKEMNGECVNRFCIKSCIDIIMKYQGDFFTKHCTGIMFGLVTNSAKFSVAQFKTYYDCFERYGLLEIGTVVLQQAMCVPLVSKHFPLLNQMLDNSQIDDLVTFYTLSKFISDSCVDDMGKAISAHVGKAVKASKTVEEMIKWNVYYTTISKSIDKMANYFFAGFSQNLPESFPETIAIFIDGIFNKKMTDVEFEAAIKDCVNLAYYIKDKDEFFLYYKKLFSRRLLTAKNIESERSALAILKTIFANSYIHSLEIMFRDIETASDLNSAFKAEHPSTPVNVSVLTQGFWPSYPLAQIPNQMQEHIDRFIKFYKKSFQSRNLKFLLAGSFELKFGKYTIITNVPQALILLAIDSGKPLSETGISENIMTASLKALTLPKHKILIEKGGEYSVNQEFKSKTYAVKITQLTKRESPSEKVETKGEIEKEREFKIDAAIIRILKSAKVLDYNSIVIQVTSALAKFFSVVPIMIKKRLESLIEREYVSRDEADSKRFTYVA